MIKIIGFETRPIYDCENCGCRFSDKEDIKEDKLYSKGELKAVISYIECPHCGKRYGITTR